MNALRYVMLFHFVSSGTILVVRLGDCFYKRLGCWATRQVVRDRLSKSSGPSVSDRSYYTICTIVPLDH